MTVNKIRAHGKYGHHCIGKGCKVVGCGLARNHFEGSKAMLTDKETSLRVSGAKSDMGFRTIDSMVAEQDGGFKRGELITILGSSNLEDPYNPKHLTGPYPDESTFDFLHRNLDHIDPTIDDGRMRQEGMYGMTIAHIAAGRGIAFPEDSDIWDIKDHAGTTVRDAYRRAVGVNLERYKSPPNT